MSRFNRIKPFIVAIISDLKLRKALKMAISQLEQVGVYITGVILNNVDVKHDRYYDLLTGKFRESP